MAGTILLAWYVCVRFSVCWNSNSEYIQCIHSSMGTFSLYCSRRDRFRRNHHRPVNCFNLFGRHQRPSHLIIHLIVDQATATGMSYLFRSTGSVVGITTTQCVLQNLLKTWLTKRITGPNAEYVICIGENADDRS